jgi:hypothetical protein
MVLAPKSLLSSCILSIWVQILVLGSMEGMNSFVVKKEVAYLFLTQDKKTVIDCPTTSFCNTADS